VSSYIEEHRERFGVEPICRTLEVSASAYYERAKGERSPRALEDERLLGRIAEIHERQLLRLRLPAYVDRLTARGRGGRLAACSA
jgi:hypothetical protein